MKSSSPRSVAPNCRVQGYGTFELTDKVAMNVEGIFRRRNGFVRDIVTDNDKCGEYQNWSVRRGLKAELSDSLRCCCATHSDSNDPTTANTNAFVNEDGNAGFLRKIPTAAYGTNDTTGRALVYYFLPAGAFTTPPYCLT